MEIKDMTPLQKGNVGLSMAIAYYSSKGYVVSLPLNDNQDYDLIVDIEEDLKKVQVKTTNARSRSNKDIFTVSLRTITSSTTGVKNIKNFDEVKVDYLFVATSNGDMYEIPRENITVKSELTLTSDRDIYKVGSINIF